MSKPKKLVDTGYFSINLRYLLKNSKRGEQTSLADKAEIDKSVFSQIKNGTSNISLKQAGAICEILGETIDDMFRIDLRARDARLKGELLGKIRLKIRQKDADEELIGTRPFLVNDITFKRFEGNRYYVYYYSGTEEIKLREGELELFHRRARMRFVPGRLHTNSQDYNVKLVIEHPTYVYIYGYNRVSTERLTIMLHEPRGRNDNKKPYMGGIGLAVMEGSSSSPISQRMALSMFQLPIDNELESFLAMKTKLDKQAEISIVEDRDYYKHIKKYGNAENG